MLSLQIEQIEFGLECCCNQLVHRDVSSIKLDAADSIFQIAFPPHGHRPQIEHFHIAIVISRSHNPLLRIVRVAECHCPTISPALSFPRFHNSDWSTLLPGIPHFYASISGSGYQLGCPASYTGTRYSVNGIYDLCMRVSRVNRY